jgi:ligand-binding SRPBCC domain-containing protein
MPTLHLTTTIKAPVERVFDLARSLDLHKISTGDSKEEAIAGTTSGLIKEGEQVTWLATHLGVRQTLTSLITKMDRPHFFQDRMLQGAFKSLVHDHSFVQAGEFTVMKDIFYFESPFGIFGKIANVLFLTKYLDKLLKERNAIIRKYAEGEEYKQLLK